MKSHFRFAGVFACLSAAQAHESWAPHTHSFGTEDSDLFVLCAAGLATLIAGVALFRMLCKHRRLKSAHFPSVVSPK
jgi:hypothetical protein